MDGMTAGDDRERASSGRSPSDEPTPSNTASRRGTSVKAAVARSRWQRRKRIAIRKAIGDTALRLFDEDGYDAVTTQRISAEAGISPITLFRYFPAKEDLVIGFPADGELIADLRREIGRHMDSTPRDFVRRVAPQVLGSLESAQLDDLALRLRIVRSNEALRSALYARIPKWTAAVAAVWEGRDPDGREPVAAGFAVRLSVSCIIDCVIETLL
ncbi:TetR/AcrR family transcriptional regulator [Bifidobacterium miconisargentati]|uniref:TetR/AcrR family transcriptional regulator n=1 Tax=Bifidobacterium miconisargentati TaxID=2834437 RepID=UPI001BDBB290|nr:TetR/AcrR family transcriptional regulator [Bifidobacterium miconisargentati]MBW3089232.1 TetR/AcrR family transcriptional regulator [Bifidobacterium miconisargentati]